MSEHPSNKATAMNLAELFSYHPPKGNQVERFALLREAASHFAATILKTAPDCADRTAAIRKVREALMTANAAIALEG